MRAGARLVAAVLILGCLGVSGPLRADESADTLWLRAVRLSDASRNLVPGTMWMRGQELDKHGKPKDEDKYYEARGRLFLGDDGEVEFETVEAIEDGEDVTEKVREKERKEKAEAEENEDEEEESFGMQNYDPFDPESQDRVSLTPVGEQMLDTLPAMVYDFKEVDEEEEKEVSGRAWLDGDSGAPLKVEYTLDPLPRGVKKMLTTIEYAFAPPDSLMVTRVTMRATGGFLFIKKHFKMDMTFDDYWLKPEEEEVSTEELESGAYHSD
jgi:hypothetical protein